MTLALWRLPITSRDAAFGYHQRAGPLAQLAEQRTFNPWVLGSIPRRPTIIPGRRSPCPTDARSRETLGSLFGSRLAATQ
jgi:hypothetical protein